MHWLSGTLAVALGTGQPGASVDASTAPAPVIDVNGQAPSVVPESALAPTPSAPSAPSMKRATAYSMLLGGGAAMLGLFWAGGMIGAVQLDSGDGRTRSIGAAMAIPLGGPFFAAKQATDRRDRAAYAGLGVEQLAALAVTMAGAIGVAEHLKYDRARGVSRQLRRGTKTAMIVGGIGGAAFVYGMTVGLSGDARRLGYGRRYLIPVVGGIAVAPRAPTHAIGVGALTSGALQIAGVGIAMTGIAFAMRRKRRESGVTVIPVVGRGHAQLTAALRF